jgi:hypothetical protein
VSQETSLKQGTLVTMAGVEWGRIKGKPDADPVSSDRSIK